MTRSGPVRGGRVDRVLIALAGVAVLVLVTGCSGGDRPPPAGPTGPDPSAGASGGTATPGNGGTPTPGLPGELIGVMPEAHGHLGPYVDRNGNLYTVVEDFAGAGGNEPKAMRSTTAGATWVEVDRAGRPSAGDLEADWLVQAGTTLSFGYQKSNGSVFVAAFHTSDAPVDPDSWTVVDEKVHDATVEPDDQWVGLAPLAGGDLWVLYATDPTSRQTHRIGVRKRSADGALDAEFSLDPDRTVSQAVAVAGGGGDVTHVFYKDHVQQQIRYRSLAADGTLGPSVRVDTAGVHRVFAPMTNPVVHRVDGAEVVTVAWADPVGVLQAVTVDGDGVPGAPRQLSDVPVVVDPGRTTNRGAVAHLASDGSSVHAVYADASTQDVWYDALTDGSGWGVDVEIADGLQIQWLTGSLVFRNRGGSQVLGYLYDTGPHGDDDGIIRYHEHVPHRE